MPELPEVETIARALREGGRGGPPLTGLRIDGASLLWARTLATPAPEVFLERIRGQVVQAVGRRGKFIVIPLSLDTLLIHLRMSGDLRVEARIDAGGQALPYQKHDRLVIDFSVGERLAFNDARKFGRVWLTPTPEDVLGGLGPEPLDERFNAAQLFEMLTSRRRQLKPLLLDQTFLAGMGNIYTDEALHMARLHPNRLSDSVSLEQAGRLFEAIRVVLLEGIRRNGASIDWVYRGGDFQNSFRVYQQTGKACPVCGHVVERTVVGQRGTHFCPVCQPVDGHEAQ